MTEQTPVRNRSAGLALVTGQRWARAVAIVFMLFSAISNTTL